MKNVLGNRIKVLRSEKRISQAELSRAMGKSDSVSRMWELGKSNPDLETIVALAKYFNCSTDFLLGLSNFASFEDKVSFEALIKRLYDLILSVPKNVQFTIYDCLENMSELYLCNRGEEGYKEPTIDLYKGFSDFILACKEVIIISIAVTDNDPYVEWGINKEQQIYYYEKLIKAYEALSRAISILKNLIINEFDFLRIVDTLNEELRDEEDEESKEAPDAP